MKKTLLAAAVLASVSGVATAATSVTLYGIVDVGYGYTSTKTTDKVDGVSSSTKSNSGLVQRDGGRDDSRIGVKGQEDLGNGLSAIFQAEMLYEADVGGSASFDQSYVGLKGSFGEVTVGRRATIVDDVFGYNSKAYEYDFGNMAPAFRYSNSLSYRGAFGGLSVGADITTKEETNNVTDGRGKAQLGVEYAADKFSVAVGYAHEAKKQNLVALGLKYDFGMAKAYTRAHYVKNGVTKDKTFGISAGADFKATPMDTVGVSLSYRKEDNSNTTAEDKTLGLSMGYVHNLSKRTNVYARAGYYRTKSTDSLLPGYSETVKSAHYRVGLQHNF